MTCSTKALAVLACLMISTAIASPALADKGGKGHGKDKHQEWSYHDDDDDRGPDIIVIDNRDRVVIRDYVAQDYHRHCPPGLAKKHNGCLPPGQAKKYRVGHTLPPDVVYYPVPRDLLVELQPVPAGYEYVRVDKDVLLISEASHKVIDAITLLSAVGN